MRKSGSVALGLLAAFALSSCNRQQRRTEMQRCVDDKNFVVDDNYCNTPADPRYPRPYRWYYGGTGSYFPGTYASGGAYSPHSGFSGVRSSGISRGGFGSYMGSGGKGS